MLGNSHKNYSSLILWLFSPLLWIKGANLILHTVELYDLTVKFTDCWNTLWQNLQTKSILIIYIYNISILTLPTYFLSTVYLLLFPPMLVSAQALTMKPKFEFPVFFCVRSLL